MALRSGPTSTPVLPAGLATSSSTADTGAPAKTTKIGHGLKPSAGGLAQMTTVDLLVWLATQLRV